MARVLIVDDETASQQLLRRILRRDCDVCVADSADAALDLLEAGERYELILYDINLLHFTGIDLRARLESQFPEQSGRFAYIVGDADEAHGSPALEKPFSISAVRRFVSGMLQSSFVH